MTVGSTNGDFDNDGKQDLIDSTGCAFLTEANIESVAKSNLCTSVYSDEMYKGKYPTIGQAFVFSKDYTYVAKKNEKWEIHSAKR